MFTPIPAELGGPESFVHKRIIGAVGGFIGGGPTGAVSGFLSGGRSSRPVTRSVPSSLADRFGGLTLGRSAAGGCPPGFELRSGECRPKTTAAVVPTPGLRGLGQRLIPGGRDRPRARDGDWRRARRTVGRDGDGAPLPPVREREGRHPVDAAPQRSDRVLASRRQRSRLRARPEEQAEAESLHQRGREKDALEGLGRREEGSRLREAHRADV